MVDSHSVNHELLERDNMNQGKVFLNAKGESIAQVSDETFPRTIEEVDASVRVRHKRSSAREIYIDHYLQKNINVYECELVVWQQNLVHRNFTSRYRRKTSYI